MDSYARAYGALVKLQVLQELQAAAPLLLTMRTQRDEKQRDAVRQLEVMSRHWKDRLSLCGGRAAVPRAHRRHPHRVLRMGEGMAREGVFNGDRSEIATSAAQELRELTASGLSQTWLRFAKSARAAGHVESATHALAQAAVHDSVSSALVGAKMAWEGGRPHEAILRLQQQRRSLTHVLPARAAGSGSSEDDPMPRLTAKTLVRLARYQEEQLGDAEHDEIKRMHVEAGKLCPNWDKLHYYHGRFLDNHLTRNLKAASRKEVTKLGPANSRSTLQKLQVKTPERQGKMMTEYTRLLPDVIRYYGLTLRRGMRHSALALSRMLSHWLEFADLQVQIYGGAGVPVARAGGAGQSAASNVEREEKCHAQMEQLISQVPPYQWLPEVAQLVSRTTHSNTRVRKMIHSLLATLLAAYPAQLSWSIVARALDGGGATEERRDHRRRGASQAHVRGPLGDPRDLQEAHRPAAQGL